MKEAKTSIFDYLKQWHLFAFNNCDLISPNHSALYFYCINKANEFNWVDKFGLPSEHSMHSIGIKSYKTYKNTLDDLIEWGFIKLITKSENQYTANIISLPILQLNGVLNFTESHTKPSTKAPTKPLTKPHAKPSTTYNKTNRLTTNETIYPTLADVVEYFKENGYNEIIARKAYDYYSSNDWKDKNNKKIVVWKLKMRNWFSDDYKIVQNKTNDTTLYHPPQSDFMSYHEYEVMCSVNKLTPKPRDLNIFP